MGFTLCAFADEADASLEGQIAALRENQIPFLELRSIDGENLSRLTQAKIRDVRDRLDEAGVRVWSIGSPTGKIGIGEAFAPHYDGFCRMLEFACLLGASRYRLFSFYGTEGALSCEPEILERLSRFAERAKVHGVTLCHENEKGIYGDRAARCLRIHKALPGIKAVFDPANFIQCGEDVMEALRLLRPYIDYLHIKDALPDGEVVPAGQGIGRITELLSSLEGQDFVLTLEPHLYTVGGTNLHGKGEHAVDTCVYGTQRQAFDTAVKALKSILLTGRDSQ